MGLIGRILTVVFGDGRNVVRETAEVFRENSEAGAMRDYYRANAAHRQFGAEFRQRRGWFDVVIDGLNRLPRPMMAMGTIGLFISAMSNPIWFSERMQGLALVPEALWWLMGAIVSFYFGARHQAKGQDFQREIAQTMGRVPQVVDNIRSLRALEADSPGAADTGEDLPLTHASIAPEDNRALEEWRRESRINPRSA